MTATLLAVSRSTPRLRLERRCRGGIQSAYFMPSGTTLEPLIPNFVGNPEDSYGNQELSPRLDKHLFFEASYPPPAFRTPPQQTQYTPELYVATLTTPHPFPILGNSTTEKLASRLREIG